MSGKCAQPNIVAGSDICIPNHSPMVTKAAVTPFVPAHSCAHIVVIIVFIQSIYNYIPEASHVSRVHSFAANVYLQFIVQVRLLPLCKFCTLTLVLHEVCVQCPVWLLSVVP